MFTNLKKFIHSEDGAVTIDWVVLTASITLLGLVVVVLVGTQATTNSDEIGQFISDIEIESTF